MTRLEADFKLSACLVLLCSSSVCILQAAMLSSGVLMWRGLRLTSSCQPVWCCCVAAQCVSNKPPCVAFRSQLM